MQRRGTQNSSSGLLRGSKGRGHSLISALITAALKTSDFITRQSGALQAQLLTWKTTLNFFYLTIIRFVI